MSNQSVVLSGAQRQAVEWDGGPLLVLAGPGAGKTEVLAERVVRIVRNSPKRRFRVLGLTFTNFAAGEMKQRVALRLGRESDRVRLGTFHSFCAGVLRQHGSHLGLRPDFRILTLDGDRAVVLADALGTRAPWGSQPPPAQRIARNLDALFRADPDLPATSVQASSDENGWGRWLLEPYVSRLIENNCMDFGSLLFCCLRLIRARPQIASDFPIAYPYVLVDEYQDTNAIQDRLLRELWPPGSSQLFVVADDDQMIFQWNGASPERISALRDDYRTSVLGLPESFRCPPVVVELANRLMAASPPAAVERVDLVAAGSNTSVGSVRVRNFPNERNEISWVAGDVRERALASGACAVLARTGKLVEAAYRELRSAGIAAWSRKPRDEFASPGVRFLVAALRLANTPHDGAQLRFLAKALSEATGVSVAPASVEARAEVENGALLAAFAAEAGDVAESLLASDLVRQINDSLSVRQDYQRFTARTLDLLESEQQRLPQDADRQDEQEEIAVWRSLAAQIRKQFGKEVSLAQFLHELDLRPIVAAPARDEVRCLTIHQAKGKSFRHVYLIGLADDLLPVYHAKNRDDSAAALEEERRNCFVAITRASETLTLTCARMYYGWPKKPSPFLEDMRLLGATQVVGAGP